MLDRIARLGFRDALHHAEASQCDIKIELVNDSLLLEISDNGKGLSSKKHAGVGLNSIRERATELGGVCKIENLPTGGTRVEARLPIAKE